MFRRKKNAAASNADEGIFGDEAAAARDAEIHALEARITELEKLVASQFTSLANYAQIAQEHTEFVRSETRHEIERATDKVIGLIERERADRLADAPLAPTREPLRLVETPAHLDRTVEESLAHAMRSLDGATLLDQVPDPEQRVHLELA